MYAGSCPDDYTLVTASVDSTSAWYSLPSVDSAIPYRKSQPFCIKGNSFVAYYHGAQSVPLMFSKEESLFDEFIPTNPSQYCYPLTVQWEKSVAFSSKLSYFVGEPKKRWSEVDFNEKDWKSAVEGTWGSYGSSSIAAFRAGFKISNDQGYSYAILLLRGEGTASVFVNGASFGKATLKPAASRVIVPFSFLTSGDNVIAVSLAKGASSTISFALSVELSTASHLRLTEGVASAIQTDPDPEHPAGDAFLDDDVYTHYWLTKTFPSELVFTFNMPQVVNRVRVIGSDTRKPFSIQVVGVNGDERVLLASFNRDSIAQSTAASNRMLSFNNLRAFSSIHLVFDSTAEECTVQMTGIRFYGRSLYTCPKKWSYSGVYEDQTIYKRCPLGYTGRRARSCVGEGSSVHWEESREQCFTTNPSKVAAFVDWSFTIKGIAEAAWEKKKAALVTLLTENTYLRTGDIAFLYVDFVVEGENTVLKGFSRCTIRKLMGEVIRMDLEEIAPRFSELVTKNMGAEYSGSIDEVTLHEYVNWFLVILFSVIAVILIALLAVYFASRAKKGDLKRLAKRTGDIQEQSLLV